MNIHGAELECGASLRELCCGRERVYEALNFAACSFLIRYFTNSERCF